MPKIKVPAIDVTKPSVPDIGIQQKGVASAQFRTPVSRGEEIGAQILGDVGDFAEGVVKHYVKKNELLRQSLSQELQTNIADEFMERLKFAKNQKGTQATGLLDRDGWHYGVYESLEKKYVTENLDQQTRKEVKKALDTEFLQERRALIGHTIRQADIANKQIATRLTNNALSYVNELNIYDKNYLESIENKATELADAHILRNPDRNYKQLSDTYREELLFHGMIKSFMEEPVVATKLWEDQEAYFEKNLPTKYDNLATKYKTAKDDAKYDIVDFKLRSKHNDNYAAMADDIEKNYIKYDLHADAALELGAKYRGIHNFKYSEDQRTRTETADEYILGLDKQYRDPDTGLINLVPYFKELEQGYRSGVINKAEKDHIRNQAMTGELSNEEYLGIMDDIHNNVITNKPQLHKRLAGRSTKKLLSMYSQLEKEQADALKGLLENQLNAAEQTFRDMARDQSIPIDKRPNIAYANTFKNQLRAWALDKGLSSRNSQIHEEAMKRLQRGWYYKYSEGKVGEFHEGEVGLTDKLKAILPGMWVESGYRWRYDAEQEALKEDETATGGSPKIDPKVQEAINFLNKVYPEADELDMENIQWAIKELEENKQKGIDSGVSK